MILWKTVFLEVSMHVWPLTIVRYFPNHRGLECSIYQVLLKWGLILIGSKFSFISELLHLSHILSVFVRSPQLKGKLNLFIYPAINFWSGGQRTLKYSSIHIKLSQKFGWRDRPKRIRAFRVRWPFERVFAIEAFTARAPDR